MPKKRAPKKDASGATPKQLRKRLRKAEDQLQDAVTKRDRAQARVEALSIIADEVRAQLADLEQAEQAQGSAEEPEGTADDAGRSAPAKQPPAKKPTASKPTASRTPAAARRTAAAASSSATATARKTAGAKKRETEVTPGPTTG